MYTNNVPRLELEDRLSALGVSPNLALEPSTSDFLKLFLGMCLDDRVSFAQNMMCLHGEKGVQKIRDIFYTPWKSLTLGLYDPLRRFTDYVIRRAIETARNASSVSSINDDHVHAALDLLTADRLISGVPIPPRGATIYAAAKKGEKATEDAVLRCYVASRRVLSAIQRSPQRLQLASILFRLYHDDKEAQYLYSKIRHQERLQAQSAEQGMRVPPNYAENIGTAFKKLRALVPTNGFELMPHDLEDAIATIGSLYPDNILLSGAGNTVGGTVRQEGVDILTRRKK